MSLQEESGVQYAIEKTMPYHEFLKRINRVTNIPITLLHNSILEFEKQTNKINPKHINENSMATFIKNFDDWKNKKLQGRFRYSKSNTTKYLTALTHADGSPRNEIVQGKIGTKFTEGIPSEKYLYDLIVYDSPLEQKNINESAEDEVVVYGKIPRNSVAIPIITGGTYSPDFMYVVKKATGEKELNIIVETKDVENKTELRGTEEIKINCAKEFFKQLTLDGYTVHFHTQLKNKKMKQIIEEVLL